MITPAEVVRKAERLYPAYLRAWLAGEAFFPRAFPVGSLPQQYTELRVEVERLLKRAKLARHATSDATSDAGETDAKGALGYTVELRLQQTRRFGEQSLPERVCIESEADYLYLIGKEKEFAGFREDVALIRERLPQLDAWLAQHPQEVIAQHGAWPDLLAVCRYFIAHPRPNLYVRELPIPVHTKFIETHTGALRQLLEALLPASAIAPAEREFERRFGLRYDEPLARLRFLDDSLRRHYHLPFSDFSAPLSQLAALDLAWRRCVITENKMTFLTLPPLYDTFALWGGGFGVEALTALDWLAECTVIYWGDLDAHGFQILSLLRASFPEVVSVMMDEATYAAFEAFAVAGPQTPVMALPHLRPEEHALYERLARTERRLEQEHISQAYVSAALRALLKAP